MFFINLFIALIPFWSLNPDFSAMAAEEEYCNERYGFCVNYPDHLFDEASFSDNGDGIALATQDGRVKMEVMGSYNVMNWSTEEILKSYFRAIKEKPMEVKLSELHTDSTGGWAKMEYNYEIQWFKVNMMKDAYVTTVITVPGSSPELVEELSNTVTISFPEDLQDNL